jgi:hypothetical protein
MKRTAMILVLALSAFGAMAETPTERAQMYFDALKAADYKAAAGHVDVGQLAEFREAISFYKLIPEPDQRKFIATFFGHDRTPEFVDGLSDANVFSAILAFIFERAIAADMTLEGTDILGSVEEGVNLRHLVTRTRTNVGKIESSSMEVVTVSRSGEGWRVMMSGRLKGLPAQMKAAFARKQG